MKKKWSILVVPNTCEAGINISVSARALKLGAICVAIAIAAAIGFCSVKLAVRNKNHARAVDHLEQEIGKRDSELATIREDFGRLLSLEDKLRTIAGLKPRQTEVDDVGKGGKGGPETSAAVLYPPDRSVPPYSFAGDESANPEAFLRAIDAAYDGFTEISEAFEKEQDRLSSIPSINPVYSPDAWVSSGYGHRIDPINGEKSFHDSVDIVAPRKTPIIAPADGVVTYSGWRAGLGRTVEIRHGYGYRTLYGHNQKLSVKKGDSVKRGDIIALMGSTGRSTGPHLHYQIAVNGKTKNPHKYIID